jgi:hypothetical protein
VSAPAGPTSVWRRIKARGLGGCIRHFDDFNFAFSPSRIALNQLVGELGSMKFLVVLILKGAAKIAKGIPWIQDTFVLDPADRWKRFTYLDFDREAII